MRVRLLVMMGASVAAMPLAPGFAQVGTQGVPATTQVDPLSARPPVAPPSVQAAPAPLANPPGALPLPVEPPAPPPPPPLWQVSDAQELLTAIRAAGADGLDPSDYDATNLDAAIRGNDPAVLAQVATDSFNKYSWALAMGHVARASRQQWYVTDGDLTAESQRALLLSALAQHNVSGALQSLLPTHPQYGALKAALVVTAPSDTLTLNRIRLNMDRWRWLPRDLGNKYIIVNVPGQFATLVENSQTRWKHRAIAGAVTTQTPQLSVMATGVILNPWWEVPKSIAGSVAGKAGYVAVKGKDGKVQRWRQPPGPSNALGKMKFVMGNPHAIYLHDTNNRGLFDSRARFLSHGCIRTEKILDLASELLSDDGGEWNQERVDAALASGKTVQANFVKPVPVYIVYFSAAALVDGKIQPYHDLYKRDAPVLAALYSRNGRGPLTKPAVKAAVKAPVKKVVKTSSN